MEALDQFIMFKVSNKDSRSTAIYVALVSLLMTLNRFSSNLAQQLSVFNYNFVKGFFKE